MNWRRPLLTAGLRVASPVARRELALLREVEFDRDALRRLHEERLTALLRHAWATTDYYREVLGDVGVVRGGGTVDLARFGEIPFLTKDIIREQSDQLTSRALPRGRRVRANATSGSTGQPTRFLQDSHYWDVNVATKTFHFGWFGKRLGDRELKLWGSEHDLLKGRESLASRAASWIYNRRSEQCFVLPEERVREIVGRIDEYRPASIWAYRDGIDVVAQHINRHGLRVHRPKAVFLGNGTIYPHVVESVGRAFGAPVVNLYGSREMGDVACQCPELGGLHVSANSHEVEVVDARGRPAAPGEEGELAITSLHNHAMPLIRYRIGDRAATLPDSCRCGRAFPLIGAVSGRVVERLVNARGDSVDPLFLIHAMAGMCELGHVRRFQVVQEAPDRLTFNIVLVDAAGRGPVAALLPEVTRDVRVVMGAGCAVDHRFVDDIPLTASGKHPYVVRRAAVRGPLEAAAAVAVAVA
jgi:phenylacetate-CoA ligase